MDASLESTLRWAVREVIELESAKKRLAKKGLVVKLGVDPTSKDLHLGHAVVLRKLQQFQALGHQAVLVIGDFTARIGDPAGVNVTRPVLSEAQIKENMKSYFEQASLIIDRKKTKVVYNSRWLAKMSLSDLLVYTMQISLNTLIEREDFANRLKANQSVGLHELLYPLTQAIDSVHLRADVELGGWDQRLNLLLGRELQKKLGQVPQDIVTVEPLIGLDGQKKMSSSLGNYIALGEPADQMFGKVMSIPDSLVVHYGYLAADLGRTEAEVKKLLSKIKHPRDRKAFVAKKIVELYHSLADAEKAAKDFDSTFRDRQVVEHLASPLSYSQNSVSILEAVSDATDSSRSQAARLIEQGAVELDGKKITDPKTQVDLSGEPLLKVGKHTFRRLSRRR